MLYKVGEKYDGSVTGLKIEILSFCPGGQIIQGDGYDQYEIIINGLKTKMSEPILALLIGNKVIENVKTDIVIEMLKTPICSSAFSIPKKKVKKPVEKLIKKSNKSNKKEKK